jgi:PLP dependent protein
MTCLKRYYSLLEEIKGAQLVVVSKNRNTQDILEIYHAGSRDFGESYVKELLEKKEKLPTDIRWHFIGPLQRNKVAKLLPFIHLIHSVDSVKIAEEISKRSLELKKITSILLQINTSKERSKQGFLEEDFSQQLEEMKKFKGIEIKGVMTMAPLTEDKKVIRRCFSRLAEIAKEEHLGPLISMGMSNDYQEALEEGATVVRIGSLLFKLADEVEAL